MTARGGEITTTADEAYREVNRSVDLSGSVTERAVEQVRRRKASKDGGSRGGFTRWVHAEGSCL